MKANWYVGESYSWNGKYKYKCLGSLNTCGKQPNFGPPKECVESLDKKSFSEFVVSFGRMFVIPAQLKMKASHIPTSHRRPHVAC